MTMRGTLHLPMMRTPHVLERDLRGHNSEPKTNGFPPEAVARLRAACQPRQTTAPAQLEEQQTEEGSPLPQSKPRPRIVAVRSDFPFETLHGRDRENNLNTNRFMLEHFASWYEWWRKNMEHVSKSEMMALTGVHRSQWYRHEAAYRKNKSRYAPAVAGPAPVAETLPPLNCPTMHEFMGQGNHQKGAFIREHFATWLAYKNQYNLHVATMSSLVGVAQSVWYTHQAAFAKNPGKYKGAR